MEPRTALPRLAASVLMLVVALACAPAPAAPRAQPAGGAGPAPAQTEGLQALIDGARQEGQLSLVWGAGTMGGREGVARLAEGFNRAYGLNVDIQYTIGLSFPEMAAKVIQEYQAGRRATTDILLGSDNSINAAVR